MRELGAHRMIVVGHDAARAYLARMRDELGAAEPDPRFAALERGVRDGLRRFAAVSPEPQEPMRGPR